MTHALTLSLLASSLAVAAGAWAAPVVENGKRFTIPLTGAAECNAGGTCNLGDPDGSGEANLVVNVGQNRICYELTVRNITLPASAAHIHIGAANSAGGVSQGLIPPNSQGTSSACIDNVDRDLLNKLVSDSGNYYVNVHTSDFPAGAVRGQLSTRAPR